ncbi:hypothetical protein scyTo_0021671, partial [Scyliorhinus torazame]|nr:hypothetical protein [Scyliorhinus torazame]
QYPLMELSLLGSRVAYKFKRSKKIQHELKITTASNETVVLGLQSREQTEDWRKVVEEVSSNTRPRASPWNSPKMPGTENKCASSKPMLRGIRRSDSDRSTGEMVADSLTTRDTGYLKVLVNSHWQTLWCHIEDRVLLMYKDVGGAGRLRYSVDLQGCEVRTQADPTHKFRLTVSHQHKDLAVLQASSPEDRDRWLSLLQARCGTDTESMHLYEDTVRQTGTEPEPSVGNQVSGLLQRRITTPNTYMDDPFGHMSVQTIPEGGGSGATRQTRVDLPGHEVVNRHRTAPPARDHRSNINNNNTARYNTLPSERRALPKLEEKIRRLEQAVHRAKERVKSGSELNLLSLSKTFKRASCGQSVALFSSNSDTANPQVPIASPSLRRTASAKGSLRRTPSVTVVEKGRVLRKTKLFSDSPEG